MTVHLYPDAEQDVVDVLEAHTLAALAALADLPSVTVGLDVPTGWKPSDPPHLQVRADGGTADDMPIAGRVTVSLTARADTLRRAKRLVIAAQAVVVGRTDLISAVHLAGPITARDAQTNADLAMATVLVVARSIPA